MFVTQLRSFNSPLVPGTFPFAGLFSDWSGYGIPIELFGPFADCCVEVMHPMIQEFENPVAPWVAEDFRKFQIGGGDLFRKPWEIHWKKKQYETL